MAPDRTFVFLLHSPVADLSQLDRVEQSQQQTKKQLDTLTNLVRVQSELLHRLIESLADEGESLARTLDGDEAGQERDTGQSLG